METHDTIWVIGLVDSHQRFRGMVKVYNDQVFHSANDVFAYYRSIDPAIAACFRVFEVPISKVVELKGPEEEGKAYRSET